MYTRDQFIQMAIEASQAKYPAVAALIKAGDPRILQQIEAQATMLAMYSQQLEVAQSEPFEKTRDSTVLADAAMRGLVPKSRPATVQVIAENKSGAPFIIAAGRYLMDPQGRSLRVEAPVEIPAGGSGLFRAVQLYEREVTHIVSGSRPFYTIQISMADDDASLCGLSVADGAGVYEYRERYVNTREGERIYHVEADERQRVYVRFGQDGVVGTQPVDGTEITINALYSLGDVEFSAGALLVFETMQDPAEAMVEMRLDEVLVKGQNPPSMRTLRELAKYPSVYNHNAVFLGEFDFLIRRNFPDLQFLSVWNEGVEESVRGMNLDNINALFIACLSGLGGEPVLSEAKGETVAPVKLTELTATQEQIKAKVRLADDSYRVYFYTPIRSEIEIRIQATVATSYEEQVVQEQIVKVMLEHFGEAAPQSRRGQSTPLYQQVYQILRREVPALSVGRADLKVYIDESADVDSRPELWRYVSPSSLLVGVVAGNVTTPYWGSGL